MAETLLDRLSKKYTPKKMKPVEIQLERGQYRVDVEIVDETDTEYNMESFKERLLQHRGTKTISKPKIQLTIKDIAVKKREEEEEDETPKKITKKLTLPGKKKKKKIDKSKLKKRKPIEDIVLDIEPTLIQIEDRPIGDRIKEKEPSVNIKMSAYYLNNREYFVNFVNTMFRKYSRQLEKDGKEMTCDSLKKSKGKDFSLMTHQQIVRDYINIYTPYRGLLLYHGLGAGKTCASIAIAEGIKDTNQVIIMTPASLRMNYISELKHCGDPIYKTNQYWEKIITKGNTHLEKALSEVLNLPVSWINKQGWVWMIDVKKPSNYEKLLPEDQKSIDKQINEMILKKYKFINYNGIRESHLNSLIREASNRDIPDEELEDEDIDITNYKNPFDDKVIIIDEAHNFVSRIVNKLKTKKKSLSIKLYELILRASNCRVIFLTGTPVINYPNEIAVLFNMLRGYIKTFIFKSLNTAETGETVNQAFMQKIFKKESLLDYMDYNPTTFTLTFTRNPFGFVNTVKRKKGTKQTEYAGVNNKGKKGLKSDTEFIQYIKNTLKKYNIIVERKQIEIKNYKALPDQLDIFKDLFIDPVNGEMKEVNHFKRRILGLTSYFRSAAESLLPAYEDTPQWKHVEKIPMSNYQVGIYEKARKAERKEEDRNKKQKAKQKDDIYAETSSSYRIFSRAFCNFVFPNKVVKDMEGADVLLKRPMPKSDQTLEQAIVTTRKEDDDTEMVDEELDEDIMDGAELQDKLENQDGIYSQEDATQIEKQVKELVDTSYKSRIDNALHLLKLHGDTYLSPTGLQEYSPKFLRVLENINNPNTSTGHQGGLHLIYTQFRTVEGVGILSLILEQNGFARFKISKKSGAWRLDMTEEELGKPTYALYTGTETAEEKEIIRNVFNSSWGSVPSSLAAQLKVKNINNLNGEIIKVLMITSSGSEGITLTNTRFVHLIEPYWHPVRTDQVIGRARRICSHKDLPKELRTVEVFVYLMTFTEQQKKGFPDSDIPEERTPILSRALRDSKTDKSKIDRATLFTSDESLFEISNIKKNTTDSILRAIKSSAIDCFLHNKSNSKEGIFCYSFGSPSVNTFTYKPDLNVEEEDKVEEQNYEGKIWTAYPIKIEGIKRAIKRTHPNPESKLEKKIGFIYDLDSYMMAKEGRGQPVLIGRTRLNPKNPKKIQMLDITDPEFNEK